MSLRVVVVVLVAVAVDHERARTNTHAVYPRRFFGLSLLEKKDGMCSKRENCSHWRWSSIRRAGSCDSCFDHDGWASA